MKRLLGLAGHTWGIRWSARTTYMSLDKNPGIELVDPEPCKELPRWPQLFLAGIVPY